MDPVELVERQIDAFNRRDLQGCLDCYAQDAVMEDGNGNVIMQGQDAQRAFLAAIFEKSPDLHCDVLNRMRSGPHVVLEEHTTGLIAEGYPNDIRNVVIYRVEENKITRCRFLMQHLLGKAGA